MEINVNVRIGVSTELERFLNTLIDLGKKEIEGRDVQEESEEVCREEKSDIAEKSDAAPVAETAKVEKETVAEPDTPITDEELRTFMDIRISKLAGTYEWKDSTDPRVKAIRKGCTKAFKNIAAYYGAEKPTALTPENRVKFVEELKNILLSENAGKGDDQIPEVEWVPF